MIFRIGFKNGQAHTHAQTQQSGQRQNVGTGRERGTLGQAGRIHDQHVAGCFRFLDLRFDLLFAQFVIGQRQRFFLFLQAGQGIAVARHGFQRRIHTGNGPAEGGSFTAHGRSRN